VSRNRRIATVAVLVVALAVYFRNPFRGAGGYHITAHFKEAIALYPHSTVKVMGVAAGTVDGVHVDGSGVRVDMTIHDDVPLSPDVTATINALTIIGERNVVLGPPWKPGQARIGDGFVIPTEHTTTPIEPDDALRAFRDLANAIDPSVVTGLVQNAEHTFTGHEQTFNDVLQSASTISTHLASEDDRILQAATDLHTLATTANERQATLGHVIDAFSQASGLLANERDQIAALLSGANRLVDDGTSLLDAYRTTLPGDLDVLAQLGATLNANTDVLKDLFASFPGVAQGLVNAYDRGTNTLRLGSNLDPEVDGLLGASIGRVLDQVGLGSLAPCIRIPSPC